MLRSDQVMQRGDVFVFVVWIMSTKNARFGAFFGQFPFGSLVFNTAESLSPLVHSPAFGASPDPGRSWS